MALTTMTGLPVEDIVPKLRERFEARAYKGVPGGADLTDINTGYMIERITEVFGLRGWGWKLEYEPDHMEIIGDGKRVTAHLKYAVFSYALSDGKEKVWIPIITSGVSENNLPYAAEGARTSAIGAALKSLCFQIEVYKGNLDHHNAGRGNGAKVEKVEGKPVEKPRTQKTLLEYGKSLGLDGKGVGAALEAIGMKSLDLDRWDEMVKAIEAFAKK